MGELVFILKSRLALQLINELFLPISEGSYWASPSDCGKIKDQRLVWGVGKGIRLWENSSSGNCCLYKPMGYVNGNLLKYFTQLTETFHATFIALPQCLQPRTFTRLVGMTPLFIHWGTNDREEANSFAIELSLNILSEQTILRFLTISTHRT